MHGIGGDADVRARDAEFSADGTLTKTQLADLFKSTVEQAKAIIASLPHTKLVERTEPQRLGEVSVLDAIYQVVGHVQQHVGQIILLTKQVVGKYLDLSIPRPR